jgi:hypothetical protein
MHSISSGDPSLKTQEAFSQASGEQPRAEPLSSSALFLNVLTLIVSADNLFTFDT